MRKSLLLIALLPLFALAQQKGIHFEHGSTWAQIQAKAKAENKYIFMDCFTTWCGPCRAMSANIFPLEEVGNYFNSKFISVKVQLDSNSNDNEEVKSWYKDGADIAKQYKVNVYPTYLFFAPDGSIVHRAVGSSDAKTFLAKAEAATNPDKQYYALLKKYQEGKREPDFLKKTALAAMDAYDMKSAQDVANEYIASQKDLYTKENIDFLNKFTMSSNDKGFQVFLDNPEKVDAVVGKGKAYDKVLGIVLQEEVLAKLTNGRKLIDNPDWSAMQTAIAAKYPKQAAEAISQGKVMYYQRKQDWGNFQGVIVAYMKDYGHKVSPAQLNSYAWTVFENCPDMTCVKEALDWSKNSFKDNNDPAFIDTYANILYKMGNKEEALKWEEKAVSLASESDKKNYQETIDKMKKGEKTWKM
jgi:thioredoxin-related protein